MPVDELHFAPRTRGRAAQEVYAEVARELTPADLTLLASERKIVPSAIARIGSRHHALARCLAQGMSNTEASAITGYDPSRISILKSDPTFKALVEDYRSQEDAASADYGARVGLLTLTVVENLQEKAEAGELTAGMELEIFKAGSDRTGHAPVQKSLQLNANIDLGNRLASARRRLAKAVEARVVESGDSIASTGTDG